MMRNIIKLQERMTSYILCKSIEYAYESKIYKHIQEWESVDNQFIFLADYYFMLNPLTGKENKSTKGRYDTFCKKDKLSVEYYLTFYGIDDDGIHHEVKNPEIDIDNLPPEIVVLIENQVFNKDDIFGGMLYWGEEIEFF